MSQVVQNPSSHGSILVVGRSYAVGGATVIGRAHSGCPLEACRQKGFSSQPDIAIFDNERYIGKHHARLYLDANGACWIEDLNSINGTAILRSSRKGQTPAFFFERLEPSKGYMLVNGDIIALAFNASRGPYVTLSYHT